MLVLEREDPRVIAVISYSVLVRNSFLRGGVTTIWGSGEGRHTKSVGDSRRPLTMERPVAPVAPTTAIFIAALRLWWWCVRVWIGIVGNKM